MRRAQRLIVSPSPTSPPVYPETMGIPLEEMDEIFQDAGSADLEERAPLRATAAERAATEPPKLTDEDYSHSESLFQRIFGKPPSLNASRNDLGSGDRPDGARSTASPSSQGRNGSQERNYRSLDQ